MSSRQESSLTRRRPNTPKIHQFKVPRHSFGPRRLHSTKLYAVVKNGYMLDNSVRCSLKNAMTPKIAASLEAQIDNVPIMY